MRLATKLLSLAIVAIAIGLTGAASPARAAERLIVNCFWPPQHAVCRKILPTWGKWVEEATEGRVKISIPPKSLAAPPEQWASVEKGIADVAAQFNGFIANRVDRPDGRHEPLHRHQRRARDVAGAVGDAREILPQRI